MEEDILHIALENFNASSDFELETSYNDIYSDSLQNGQLALKVDSTIVDFKVAIKKHFSLSALPHLCKQIEGKENLLLIADYISKPTRQQLKEQRISYLDTSGNAFITNQKGIYIYTETNKATPYFQQKNTSFFSKAGLKVIFQFLLEEQLLNQSYRQIAAHAKVSIDTVGRVIKGLRKEGYLLENTKEQFQLNHKERLIQEWVTFFNRILRPKLKQRIFRTKNFSQLQELTADLPFLLGGELAGELLSNHLIAEQAIIYTATPFIPTAKQLQLIPSTEKEGRVTLVEKFWTNLSTAPTVPPILVYADLLHHPTPRNLETAQIIYNQHVRNTI